MCFSLVQRYTVSVFRWRVAVLVREVSIIGCWGCTKRKCLKIKWKFSINRRHALPVQPEMKNNFKTVSVAGQRSLIKYDFRQACAKFLTLCERTLCERAYCTDALGQKTPIIRTWPYLRKEKKRKGPERRIKVPKCKGSKMRVLHLVLYLHPKTCSAGQ